MNIEIIVSVLVAIYIVGYVCTFFYISFLLEMGEETDRLLIIPKSLVLSVLWFVVIPACLSVLTYRKF